MKVFVTGGSGFVGSHYVRTLLDGGYPGFEQATVTVLDKLTYAANRDSLPATHPRLTFVEGDICDRRLLGELLPSHTAVVHFAAESHVDRSFSFADEFIRTNVAGTHRLLDACVAAGVEKVVHISTDEVYGSIEDGAWTEEWPLAPNSPYAASKAASDLVARSYWRTYGLDISITRCSNNYGPYQHPEKLIPFFITNMLEGEPLPLYGDGKNIREWLHVADHCQAVQLVLERGEPGEIYHVGGGDPHTNLAIAERLLELCGADPSLLRHVADRKAHDLRYALNGDKLRDRLGYAPRVQFSQGLAETVSWYRDNSHWWKKLKHARAAG